MQRKPAVFIGSSVEGLGYAYALQELLEYAAAPTVWDQGVFVPTSTTMESLVKALDQFDFAAFMLMPDDVLVLRQQESSATRDNVIFELGLFIGRLGRARCFIVMPRGKPDFHLPTDLLGTTAVTFDGERPDKTPALGPAANKIVTQLQTIGLRPDVAIAKRTPRAQLDAVEIGARLTVWIIGSYSTLSQPERERTEKVVSIVANGLVDMGARAVMGESDLLRDFARVYRDACVASSSPVPNPVVLPGTMRHEDMAMAFVDAMGRVPDVALVMGGSKERRRVRDECNAATSAGIPLIAIASTGGAAAEIASTAELPADALSIMATPGRAVGSGDLANTILEALRSMAAAKERKNGA